MSTVDLLARILISWCVLSIIIGGAYAVVMARHNSRASNRADVVKRAAYPPPVPHPPVKQVELDETWLDAWQNVERRDVDDLEQSIFDRLFSDQIAAEGLS